MRNTCLRISVSCVAVAMLVLNASAGAQERSAGYPRDGGNLVDKRTAATIASSVTTLENAIGTPCAGGRAVGAQ